MLAPLVSQKHIFLLKTDKETHVSDELQEEARENDSSREMIKHRIIDGLVILLLIVVVVVVISSCLKFA